MTRLVETWDPSALKVARNSDVTTAGPIYLLWAENIFNRGRLGAIAEPTIHNRTGFGPCHPVVGRGLCLGDVARGRGFRQGFEPSEALLNEFKSFVGPPLQFGPQMAFFFK